MGKLSRVRLVGGAVGALVATGGATTLAAQPAPSAQRPFSVGEKLTYDVRFGPLKVGTGALELRGIVPVRGENAYHAVFRIKGGTAFYKVDDTFESWFATDDLSSLRFHQDQNEGSKERLKKYEIFPERQTYGTENPGDAEHATSVNPLDDASFMYFLRTVPLEVGKTYTFNRYFKPDRNPITIRVVRKERVTVPAGTFDAVVLQPTIKTKGIFSEGGKAEVWLSDDDRRVLLQLKSKLSVGSINLYLTSSNTALASAR